MDAGAWIALAGLAVVVLVQAGGMLFAMGRLFSKVEALEARPTDVDCKQELAVLNTKFAGLETAVTEMAHDIKNLLTGRVVPARRAAS